MSEIPQPVVDQATLKEWYELKKELDKVKVKEMLLRKLIYAHYFPAPKEGTNTYVLPDTYQLKGVHSIDRSIVEESMQAMLQRPEIGLGDDGRPLYGPNMLEKAGVAPDQLIKWKPELAITYYRTLTAEQQHLVDQMLLVKDGSPQLKIEPPSKRQSAKG